MRLLLLLPAKTHASIWLTNTQTNHFMSNINQMYNQIFFIHKCNFKFFSKWTQLLFSSSNVIFLHPLLFQAFNVISSQWKTFRCSHFRCSHFQICFVRNNQTITFDGSRHHFLFLYFLTFQCSKSNLSECWLKINWIFVHFFLLFHQLMSNYFWINKKIFFQKLAWCFVCLSFLFKKFIWLLL